METFNEHHTIGRGYKYDPHLKPSKDPGILQVFTRHLFLINLLLVHNLKEVFHTHFYPNFCSSPSSLLHSNKDCLGMHFLGCSTVDLWIISSQPSLPDLGLTLVLKKEIKLISFLHLNPTVSELNIYNLVKKWTKYFPLILALLNSLWPLSFCLYQEQMLIKLCYVSNFIYWASITNRNMLAKLLTHIN